MLVFNTELHIITFLIIILQMVFFCHQVIYYLSRPSDKNRLYFLILLYLLIQHNLVGGLLPDPKIPISIFTQNILAYAVAFAMGMYFPYYFYKAFKLDKMKFYAKWGNFLFLLGPFVLLFAVPYYFTKDLAFSRKLAVIVPFLYTISFLYSLRSAIKDRNEKLNPASKTDIIGMYFAVILFGLLPIKGFFESNLNEMLAPILHFNNGSQVVEILTTNSGLLVMTLLFMRQTVKQAKEEYKLLLESQKRLLEANSELTLKVKERTKEIELVNEQKTNVFVNLAHETKTPLTLITNYLDEFIRKNKIKDDGELYLLKKSIGHLTRDIVNFFDMEKIQKGINMYNHNSISDFSELLNDSLHLFKTFSAKKHIEILTDIDYAIFIKADPSSLCRVINNLLENAIKYTPENGKIEVALKLTDQTAHFSVKDNGIGISSSLKDKIFEPYYQANSEKSNFQGLGLGLSIVKKIILELNGKIEINNELPDSVGTQVNIELPAYQKTDDEILMKFTDDTAMYFEVEKLNIEELPFEEAKRTILVVEDDIPLLTYLVKTLQPTYNIYFTTSGQAAIDKLDNITKLDLIISDVMMDNGDGFYLCEHLLESNIYKHIPFIFLTAKTTIDDRMVGLSLGAIDYLCKPFSMTELCTKINSLLQNYSNKREATITEINEINAKAFETNCLKYKISIREVEVIKLIAQGKINKEIADALNVTEATAKKHIQHLYVKVGVNNKIELLKKLIGNSLSN